MKWSILLMFTTLIISCKNERKEPESPKVSRAEIWKKVDRLKWIDLEMKRSKFLRDSIEHRIIDSFITVIQEDSSDLMYELISDRTGYLDSLERPFKEELRRLKLDISQYEFPDKEYDSLLRILQRLKNI